MFAKKILDKEIAINMRLKGKSYSEIANKIDVSKSTLSLWLRNISLSEKYKQRLIKRRLIYARKGATKRKLDRIKKTTAIINKSKKNIERLTLKDLWLIGIALYWAEGAKQKDHNISQRVCFSSSDPKMIKIFLVWLDRICNIPLSELNLEIYIHKTASSGKSRKFWADFLNVPESTIRTYYKIHKVTTNRKNITNAYNGLMRVVVKRSTDLNRKINGWIQGIDEQWGVV